MPSPSSFSRRRWLHTAGGAALAATGPRALAGATPLPASAYALMMANGADPQLSALSSTHRPAINPAGVVAAVGQPAGTTGSPVPESVFLAQKGQPLRVARTDRMGLSQLAGLVLDAQGRLGVVATRSAVVNGKNLHWRGVYALETQSLKPTVLQEINDMPLEPLEDGLTRDWIALSPTGQVAFSTVKNSRGNLWRAQSLAASPSPLFKKAMGLTANDHQTSDSPACLDADGRLLIGLEYSDPIWGTLKGGLFLPNTDPAGVVSWQGVVERQYDGWSAPMAWSTPGQVVLFLGKPLTVNYHADTVSSSPVTSSLTLPAGLLRIQPAPYNQPVSFKSLIGPEAGFSQVQRICANSQGHIVFEATWSGARGVFFGRDAVAHRIALVGRPLPVAAPGPVTDLRLGGLNEQGQLALVTRHGTAWRVWRVQLPPA